MLCESQTCLRMGTGAPHGSRNLPGASQTEDPVAFPMCLLVRSQVLSSTGTSLDQCTCRARGFCGSHVADGIRSEEGVVPMRSRQRCRTLWVWSGTVLLEYIGRLCGGSDSPSETMEMRFMPLRALGFGSARAAGMSSVTVLVVRFLLTQN